MITVFTPAERYVLAIIDDHAESMLGPRSSMDDNTVHSRIARGLVHSRVLAVCPEDAVFVRRAGPAPADARRPRARRAPARCPRRR